MAQNNAPILQFPDEDEPVENEDMSDFIEDSQVTEESISFYRKRDPRNLEDCLKFPGQTRNLIYSDTEVYFGEDNQTELFAPENRDLVELDKF